MRWLLPATLALQQLPALTHGYPVPCHQETGEVSPTSAQITLQPTSHTQPQTPALVGAVASDGGDEEDSDDRDLDDGEAEQEYLVVHWAELKRDPYARGRHLAEAEEGAGGIDDADHDFPSLAQTLLRKAKYAAAAIFNAAANSHDDEHGNHALLRRNDTDADADMDGTVSEDTADFELGLDPSDLSLVYLILLFLVLDSVFYLAAVRVFGYGVADVPSRSLPLTEGRDRRRRFWGRVRGVCGGCCFWQGRRRGVIRLGDEDLGRPGYGYEYGYQDEKRGGMCEKNVGLFEDGGHEGVEFGCGSESESEDEESSMADEFASFRAALEMVDGIVAAEEGRTRGNRGPGRGT